VANLKLFFDHTHSTANSVIRTTCNKQLRIRSREMTTKNNSAPFLVQKEFWSTQ